MTYTEHMEEFFDWDCMQHRLLYDQLQNLTVSFQDWAFQHKNILAHLFICFFMTIKLIYQTPLSYSPDCHVTELTISLTGLSLVSRVITRI